MSAETKGFMSLSRADSLKPALPRSGVIRNVDEGLMRAAVTIKRATWPEREGRGNFSEIN